MTNQRMVGNDLIRLASEEDHTFVYVPSRLNRQYLEGILSDSFGHSVSILNCQTTNLCASIWGGVSHSGATVLRLSLELDTNDCLDLVAKILCSDSVNLFKPDRRYSGRIAEIAWAKWWGEQNVSWVPRLYATRMDTVAREFWILQEYLPQVGWPDTTLENVKSFGSNRGRALLTHAADLHAHSRKRIDELLCIFPDEWASLPLLVANVGKSMEDAPFLAGMGVSNHERHVIDRCCQVVKHRPEWVDQWELVCVTADIAPDNVGMRGSRVAEELVSFDWSSAGLAPMEAEIYVLLGRLKNGTQKAKAELVQYYLNEYAARSGSVIPHERFMARLAWAQFTQHLGRIASCVERLRWVPFETRSRDYIHLCVGLCERLLPELAAD